MRKAHFGQSKRQSGISLIPALWDRIDEVARAAGVPRNRVMERALMDAFGMSETVHKTDGRRRSTEEEEVISLP